MEKTNDAHHTLFWSSESTTPTFSVSNDKTNSSIYGEFLLLRSLHLWNVGTWSNNHPATSVQLPTSTWTQRQRDLSALNDDAFTVRRSWEMAALPEPRPCRARHCGRWRVERLCVLRDFKTFFFFFLTKGQNQPMGALLLATQPIREGVATMMMMMTKTRELIVIGQRSMTSAEFYFRLVLLCCLWNRPITGQSW